MKAAAYSLIGPLFGSVMCQQAPPLRYLRLNISLKPLRSARTIWWSVDTLGSLMLTL